MISLVVSFVFSLCKTTSCKIHFPRTTCFQNLTIHLSQALPLICPNEKRLHLSQGLHFQRHHIPPWPINKHLPSIQNHYNTHLFASKLINTSHNEFSLWFTLRQIQNHFNVSRTNIISISNALSYSLAYWNLNWKYYQQQRYLTTSSVFNLINILSYYIIHYSYFSSSCSSSLFMTGLVELPLYLTQEGLYQY